MASRSPSAASGPSTIQCSSNPSPSRRKESVEVDPLVRRQGASFFSQINFLTPLFGVLFGALILAERPPVNAYAALAIIMIGIWIARDTRKARAP